MSKINNSTALGISRNYGGVVNGNIRNNYIIKDGTFRIRDTDIEVSKYDTNKEIVRKINLNSVSTCVAAEVTNNGIRLISNYHEVKINNCRGVLESKALNDGRIEVVGKNSRTSPRVIVYGPMLPHRAANASEEVEASVSSYSKNRSILPSKLDEELVKNLVMDATKTTSKKKEETPSPSTPKLWSKEDDKESTKELGTDDDWGAENTSPDEVDSGDEEKLPEPPPPPIKSKSPVLTLTKKESKFSVITEKVTSKMKELGTSIRTSISSAWKKLTD